MTLVWNGEAAIAAMRRAVAERLLKAAVTLQVEHMRRLGVSNPPPFANPAPRGAYPHMRTGFLMGNVLLQPASIGDVVQTLRVRVGYGASAFYGLALSDRGWKGLLDTLQDLRGQLQAILAG